MTNDDELAAVLADLESAIEDLQQSRQPPPLRPPTPAELLQFTDEAAIPLALSMVETQRKALIALRHAIRLVRTVDTQSPSTNTSVDPATLERALSLVEELKEIAVGREDPTNPQARAIVNQARELQAEIDTVLTDVSADTHGPDSSSSDSEHTPADDSPAADSSIDASHPSVQQGDSVPADDVAVDVDAELESLIEEYGAAPESDAHEGADENDGGTDLSQEETQNGDSSNNEDENQQDSTREN